jgi:diguanylate cyclase (GGDEF)-like protein
MVAVAHVGSTAVLSVGALRASKAVDVSGVLSLLPPTFLQWLLIGVSAAVLVLLVGRLARIRLFPKTRGADAERGELTVYDPVTGLPGRRLFLAIVGQALARATKTGQTVAVLIVELDHFKVVTETRGRMNGDTVIRVQAARLKGALHSQDMLARLTQDQFAAVLENVKSAADVFSIAQKVHETIGLPLTLEGDELFLSCRIGCALYPQDAADGPRLIEHAARALAIAKAQGQPIQPAAVDVEPERSTEALLGSAAPSG